MNSLDIQYQNLLKDIMTNGYEKGDRTGTGTISVFGRQIRHNMSEGFPLLTTKKMAVKTMMTELKWFLKGDTNIKYLVDNGCNIWNGDAYKNFEKRVKSEHSKYYDPMSIDKFIERIKTDDEFAEKWGELGPIYGRQWREWKTQVAIPTTLTINDGEDSEPLFVRGTRYVDQIQNLINDLKTNPDSRRLMVNAWNVGELNNMVLPPCHYGFQVYTRELSEKERYDIWFNNNYETGMERYFDPNNLPDFDNDYYEQTPTRAISLMWNQRSVDTFLGLPFNIASYATLLLLLCEEVGMIPGELIGNLGDTHIYKNHIDQANEQCGRQPYNLPTLEVTNCDLMNGEFEYTLTGYESHPTIKAPLSN
jgi:thymidylate synthase